MSKFKEITLTPEQRENFERFLELSDRYKNSWFWNYKPAGWRRYCEKKDCISYTTTVNGIEYSVDFSIYWSCRYVYVDKSVWRDGVKTTARVIRTLLEKDQGKPTAA